MSEMNTTGVNDEIPSTNEQSFVEILLQQFQPSTIKLSRKWFKPPNLVTVNLSRYATWVKEAYRYFQELSTIDNNISLVAEWILDNYYIVQQAIQLIQEDMPPGYQEQLPRLMNSPYSNFPRIFAICRSLLYMQGYMLELGDMRKTLDLFQEKVPLTTGELWTIPIFMRFGLIEKLAHVLVKEIKPDQIPEFLNFPPIFPGTLLSAPNESQAGTKNQAETVASIIRSLRLLSESDWEEIFESLSLVEKTLRQDPAGIYPNMDFKTRNLYRRKIETLAKLTGQEEDRLANSLINLCRETIPEDISISSDHPTPEHIGTYLVGEGRKKFEKFISYEPDLKIRINRQIKNWNKSLYLGGITLIAVGLIAIVLRLTHTMASFEQVGVFQILLMVIIALCLIPPAFIVANHLINIGLGAFTSPSLLPKMEFTQAVPQAYQTIVVIPSPISNCDDIEHLVRQIEIHYLGNSQPGLKFALLTDFSDADSQIRPEDGSLLNDAINAIAKLNQKYQQDHHDSEQLFFFFTATACGIHLRVSGWVGSENEESFMNLVSSCEGRITSHSSQSQQMKMSVRRWVTSNT